MTWVPIVAMAALVPYINGRSIELFYLGAALAMAVAQAATWSRTGSVATVRAKRLA